jgi:hypothetical protein
MFGALRVSAKLRSPSTALAKYCARQVLRSPSLALATSASLRWLTIAFIEIKIGPTSVRLARASGFS